MNVFFKIVFESDFFMTGKGFKIIILWDAPNLGVNFLLNAPNLGGDFKKVVFEKLLVKINWRVFESSSRHILFCILWFLIASLVL